jgi:16S rRNA (guanine966-N2)-methyltransferase
MRIISGTLKNRQFAAPGGHRTHPMSERARGAIFNILGDVSGLTIFDAFAGSGALGFEAISRGARSVLAIDSDKTAYRTLTDNVQLLGLEERVQATHANTTSWIKRNRSQQFDIAFIDPPYDTVNYAALKDLANTVRIGGLLVYSLPVGHDFTLSSDRFMLLEEKKYAGAALVFFRRIR